MSGDIIISVEEQRALAALRNTLQDLHLPGAP
jgi:hypothetical protein